MSPVLWYTVFSFSSAQGSNSTVAHPEENATDHHQHGDGKKHHKGGVMRRILGRGRGDHDGERRKSVAARKSLIKARRMRRKSGAGSRSSQSQPEDKESTTMLPKDGHGSITVRKKHSKTRAMEDQERTIFKVPAAPAEDKVKKSAKELIAAAEARQAKEGKHGTKKSETLKRKADDIGEDTKSSRSVRRKSIVRNYRTNRSFLCRRQFTVAAAKRKLGIS